MFMQLAPPAREYCLLQPREPQICHIHLVSTEKQEMQRYNRSRGGFNFDTGEGFYSWKCKMWTEQSFPFQFDANLIF